MRTRGYHVRGHRRTSKRGVRFAAGRGLPKPRAPKKEIAKGTFMGRGFMLSGKGTYADVLEPQHSAEYKYDGERIKAIVQVIPETGTHVAVTKVQLINRRGRTKQHKFTEIVEGMKRFQRHNGFKSGEFDGEALAIVNGKDNRLAEQIRSSTENPVKRAKAEKLYPLTYAIFDILALNGRSLMGASFMDRRSQLEALFKGFNDKTIILSPITWSEREKVKLYNVTKVNGLEGVMVKDINGPYVPKRSNLWLKVKHRKEAVLTFTHYTKNNAGARLENEQGVMVQCTGVQCGPVLKELRKKGKVRCEIEYQERTAKNNLYFQPSFKRLVGGD